MLTMPGYLGNKGKVINQNSTKPEDVIKNFMKEVTEQTNNNILKIINLEVIISVMIDKILEKGLFTKEEFESAIQERSEKVQKDLQQNLQEQSKTTPNLFGGDGIQLP